MRWFWLFILGLCVLTGGLYLKRVRDEAVAQSELLTQLDAQREASTPARRPRRERGSSAQTQPTEQTQPEASAARESEQVAADQSEPVEPVVEPEPDTPTELVADETQAQQEPAQGFDPGSIMETMQALKDQLPDEAHARKEKPSTELIPAKPDRTPEPTGEIVIDLPDPGNAEEEIAEADEPQGPSYELRGDGSFKVLSANAWVQGAGTESEPYVLSWEVLKSIESSYDPKNGKDTLPDWLDLLDGKFVTIEGNTLVPVVASSTRELLVMKNPWDGCCIGVPPTPFDAVEVSLNHDVDFGNSAVGYGSVVGVFYADPYVVDGWVLGVYIIEDAKYRAGEGVVFPEF
tara:strand:+ start:72291 stop:73331 length:1041 start_codon:yes stop_codon:yes gene_type:complete